MYIHYRRGTRMTGRQLRRALDISGGMFEHYRRRVPERVVRWGTSLGAEGEYVLNPANAIAKAANKLESLRIMKEAGVNVPRFDIAPTSFGDAPFFGRRRYHSGGTDIQVFQEPHTVSVFSDFFTEYVPSVRELRLHIFKGEMIGAQVKRYEGDEPEDEFPIRNHENGYVFVPFESTRPHSRRVEAAVAAVEAHGLDFGAVDMLVTPDDSTVVLEVNTAPGLSSERFLNIYTEAIGGWLEDGSE